ncbi:hypothetical protein AYO49_05620 [Verrucomicrobiaceae bacterium SCGC AG-212-N21]|nr:hypothetical protein AYO49_05620 [Verrucomicrobiaceae bacterium SCGC AG-212-N21]
MIMRRKGAMHPISIICFLLAGIFLVFLMHGGARRIIGVVLGAALTYWILDRERVRIWQLGVAAAIAALILFTMQAMLVVRSAGVENIGYENAARIAFATGSGEQGIAGMEKGFAVDRNLYSLTQVFAIVPSIHDFVYWRHLWYVMVRPIPRVLWEGKPLDGGFSLQNYDNQGASLSITVVGEMWITMGYPAVLIGGWVFGRLARVNSPLFNTSRGSVAPMFYGYMSMILVVGWRSLIEVLLFSYTLLGWMFVTWLYGKIRGHR